MARRTISEPEAHQKVISSFTEDYVNFKYLIEKTKISRGSLHRWLIQWKKEKRIGFKVRPKKDGLGYEEVYYKPEIMVFEEKIENFLKEKNKLKENMVLTWEALVKIAFRLHLDHTHPDFKKAIKNLAEKWEIRWIPGREPPE